MAARQPEDLSLGGRLGEVKRRLTCRTCSEAFLCKDLLARVPARAWCVLQMRCLAAERLCDGNISFGPLYGFVHATNRMMDMRRQVFKIKYRKEQVRQVTGNMLEGSDSLKK